MGRLQPEPERPEGDRRPGPGRPPPGMREKCGRGGGRRARLRPCGHWVPGLRPWGPPAEPKLRLLPTVKPHRPRLSASEGQEAGCFHVACDSCLVHASPPGRSWGTSRRARPPGPGGPFPGCAAAPPSNWHFPTGSIVLGDWAPRPLRTSVSSPGKWAQYCFAQLV